MGRWLHRIFPLAMALVSVGAVVALLGDGESAAQSPPVSPATAVLEKRYTTEIRPILVAYCFACHGNGKKKGDVSFDKFTTLASVQQDRKTWQHMVDTVSHKLMPPEERPQPSDAERAALAKFFDDVQNHFDNAGPRDPGHVPIRRLNRVEYNNTIRDLVGVDFRPADDFPADDTGYGFDNIADVLSVSPLLTEKYLAAAEQIMAKAFLSEEQHKKARATRIDGVDMKNTTGNRFMRTAWMLGTEGEVFTQYDFAVTGDYEIRVKASADQAGPEPAKMSVKLGTRVLQLIDVKASRDQGEVYKVPVQIARPGANRLAVGFTNNFKDPKDPAKDRNLYVHWVEIEPSSATAGFQSPILKKIFIAMPSKDVTEDNAARQILRKFATRAYRRPAGMDEVASLMKLFKLARTDGDTFEASVRLALTAVLVSPNFLFRVEPDAAKDKPEVVRQLNDYELASRLSYFLWSSMPDDELLAAAELGKLRQPTELEKQVRRMLADPKARSFVDNFAGQWLELRNLDEHTPDPDRFPGFDPKLKDAMRRETELFFTNIVKEDRSALELLDADYTYVDERLAKHYGIDGVRGSEFVKVSLKGTPRGGVLTQGAVLMVTAMPARTSPVKRGKFVLEQILGTPPPPPPADVPALPDKAEDTKTASLRERFLKHRADPNCAVCHTRMDAIGFSMENFSAVGAWRDRDGAFPIDNVGDLPGGKKINGPQGLRQMLLERKGEFIYCLTEKMMTYAVGRGMQLSDRATIKEVVDGAAKDNYRFSSLVMNIVRSDAFQKRRGKSPKEAAPATAPARVDEKSGKP